MNSFNLKDCKINSYGNYLCKNGREFFVRNVYPPIQVSELYILNYLIKTFFIKLKSRFLTKKNQFN